MLQDPVFASSWVLVRAAGDEFLGASGYTGPGYARVKMGQPWLRCSAK
jgi:hypothetical protein